MSSILGLQLAPTMLADLATEDHGDLVRLADCPIGIEQGVGRDYPVPHDDGR